LGERHHRADEAVGAHAHHRLHLHVLEQRLARGRARDPAEQTAHGDLDQRARAERAEEIDLGSGSRRLRLTHARHLTRIEIRLNARYAPRVTMSPTEVQVYCSSRRRRCGSWLYGGTST